MRKGLLGLILLMTACSPALTAETAPPSSTSTAPNTTTTATTAPPPSTTTSSTTSTTSTSTTTTTTTTVVPAPGEFFVWMPDGLIDGFADLVAGIPGIEAVTEIRSATLHIRSTQRADGTVVDQPREGYVIPVHAAIVAASGLEHIVGADGIGPDDLVLGEESAQLRRLEAGDTITFENATLTVGAVVPERVMAGYEMIATTAEPFDEERMQTRAVHVLYTESLRRLKVEVGARLDEADVYRVGARTASADRGGLPVRSQGFIKSVFGEFAYRPTGGRSFVIDPDWIEENIVEVRIPLLGVTRCHRLMADILTDVMQDLEDNGLSEVIDPDAFAGCWNGRYIADSYRLSRHSFGAAADINIFNPTDGGPGSPVHPELIRRMYDAGMTSGHVWASPDPGHFEYFGTLED